MRQYEPSEPVEEELTTWKNPLSVPQRVIVHMNGRQVKYTFAPGETKKLPSSFDKAIHIVHGSTIVGGLAPQLVNVDKQEELRLADALDTEAEERRKAEADMIAQAMIRQQAEQAQLLAAARMAEKTKQLEKK